MNLPERLVQLAAEHLGEPEIRPGKKPKERNATDHEVEVPDHESGVVKLDVRGGVTEKEATEATDPEEADRAEREHGRRSQT